MTLFLILIFNSRVNWGNTLKPVLSGHLWEKQKWPYKTGAA